MPKEFFFGNEHKNDQLEKIPQESVDGWKEKPIEGVKQELVALGPFTEFSDCDTNAIYFGERGSGEDMSFTNATNFLGKNINRNESLLTHFVRKDLYDRLLEAKKKSSKRILFQIL